LRQVSEIKLHNFAHKQRTETPPASAIRKPLAHVLVSNWWYTPI
jgi:hypothetical protein